MYEVMEFIDTSGENIFSAIFECAKRALILPNSNEEEERIFSAMNYIKCRIRNRMMTDLLNAILVTKFGWIIKGKCCMSHKLPDSVVKVLYVAQTTRFSSKSAVCRTNYQIQ